MSLNVNLSYGALSQTAASGVGRYYLAGAKLDRFPGVAGLTGSATPKFDGTIAEYIEKFPNAKSVMLNKVKICANCKKPCGYTLINCNACGASLREVPMGKSDNLLSAFILGIKMGKFPMKVCIRSQSERYLVFDDLLALSPCHILSVPTFAHIPDWRYLLEHPHQGLVVLIELKRAGDAAIEEQFWSNTEFRNKWWETVKDFKTLISDFGIFGMNFPPSQNQLHLQCCIAPFMPFHQDQHHIGNHMHWYRFFLYDYLFALFSGMTDPKRVEACKAFQAKFVPMQETTPVEAIVEEGQKLFGVDYLEYHRTGVDKFLRANQLVESFKAEDFTKMVVAKPTLPSSKDAAANGHAPNGNTTESGEPVERNPNALEKDRVILDIETMEKCESQDVAALQGDDKLAMQSYGRPYDENKKFLGLSYYNMGFNGSGDEFSQRQWEKYV